MSKSCETCRWFEAPIADDRTHQCRYNPVPVHVYYGDWCSHWESKVQTDKLCPGVCKNCKSWLSLPQICSNTSQRLTYTSPEFWCEHWCEKPKSGLGFSNDKGDTLKIETSGTFTYPPKCPSKRLEVHTNSLKSGCKIYLLDRFLIMEDESNAIVCNKIGQELFL
jgi:hypothetical protein